MKKLFLLPILAMTLVACDLSTTNNSSVSTQETNEIVWVKVNDKETLEISVGNDIYYYNPDGYKDLSYSISGNGYLKAQVKMTILTSEKVVIDTFIGSNVSVVVWGA